jgi:glutamyl-tRNA synthetase
MQEIVVVDEITDFTSMNIEIIKRLDDEKWNWMGKVMQPFRLSLVGALKALTYLTSLSLLEKRNDHKNSKAVASL